MKQFLKRGDLVKIYDGTVLAVVTEVKPADSIVDSMTGQTMFFLPSIILQHLTTESPESELDPTINMHKSSTTSCHYEPYYEISHIISY